MLKIKSRPKRARGRAIQVSGRMNFAFFLKKKTARKLLEHLLECEQPPISTNQQPTKCCKFHKSQERPNEEAQIQVSNAMSFTFFLFFFLFISFIKVVSQKLASHKAWANQVKVFLFQRDQAAYEMLPIKSRQK